MRRNRTRRGSCGRTASTRRAPSTGSGTRGACSFTRASSPRRSGFSAWEREALTCAALWHDIGRTNDRADYYHGAKSAGKAVTLGLHRGIEPRVYETALYAVTHHCGDEGHGERAAGRVRYRARGTTGR